MSEVESWWTKRFRVSSIPSAAFGPAPFLRGPNPPFTPDAEAVVSVDDQGSLIVVEFPQPLLYHEGATFSTYLSHANGDPVEAISKFANGSGHFNRTRSLQQDPVNVYVPFRALKYSAAQRCQLLFSVSDARPGQSPRDILFVAFDLDLPHPLGPFDEVQFLRPLFTLGMFVAASGTADQLGRFEHFAKWMTRVLKYSPAEIQQVRSMLPLVAPNNLASVVSALSNRAPGLDAGVVVRLMVEMVNSFENAEHRRLAIARMREAAIRGYAVPEASWNDLARRFGLA